MPLPANYRIIKKSGSEDRVGASDANHGGRDLAARNPENLLCPLRKLTEAFHDLAARNPSNSHASCMPVLLC